MFKKSQGIKHQNRCINNNILNFYVYLYSGNPFGYRSGKLITKAKDSFVNSLIARLKEN